MSRKAVFEASLAYFLEPIARFLEDETVTEIMVNGHDRIFVERKGRLEQVNARFDDEDALVSAIHNLTQYVGRDISPEQPILDARLPTGSRVRGHCTLLRVDAVEGGVQATWSILVERDGSVKPCCAAEWLVRYYQ